MLVPQDLADAFNVAGIDTTAKLATYIQTTQIMLGGIADANAALAGVQEAPLGRAELAALLSGGALNVRAGVARSKAINIRAAAEQQKATTFQAATAQDQQAVAIDNKQRQLAGQ